MAAHLPEGGDALTLRTTGIAAVLVSIIAGLTSTLLFAAAYQFRADQEPTRLLAAGASSAELLRWGSVLDLFGYYLPTAVLAYVLWRQLRPRNPLLADLSTMAGVGFALAGGAGAAVFAVFAAVGAFANLVGLSLVRDVLLGVAFILWSVWWISLLVVFLRQSETA